jgi:2-hydroxychromene-2-carboxylate isomerase
MMGEIKPADLATIRDLQISPIEFSHAAARTAAAETVPESGPEISDAWVRHRQSFHLRIDDQVDAADDSGVNGTPTFFINGQRHTGNYLAPDLIAAVNAAMPVTTG